MVYESLIIRKIKRRLETKPSFGWLMVFAISAWLVDRLINAFLAYAAISTGDATGILLIIIVFGGFLLLFALMILS